MCNALCIVYCANVDPLFRASSDLRCPWCPIPMHHMLYHDTLTHPAVLITRLWGSENRVIYIYDDDGSSMWWWQWWCSRWPWTMWSGQVCNRETCAHAACWQVLALIISLNSEYAHSGRDDENEYCDKSELWLVVICCDTVQFTMCTMLSEWKVATGGT